MTIYQALQKSNIEFKVFDAEAIGTKAGILAREKGITVEKIMERPWHKREKSPYLVNDYPQTFVGEIFDIIVDHFTVNKKPKRRRILKSEKSLE